MKKVLAVILSAALIVTLALGAVVFVSADDTFDLVVSSQTVKKGDTTTITISLKNNTKGVCSVRTEVLFPTELKCTKALFNTSGLKTYNEDEEETSMFEKNIAKEGGKVTLNWVSKSENITGDILFATLTFKVDDNATLGDKDITLNYNPKDIFYYSGGSYVDQNLEKTELSSSATNGKITVVDCFHTNTTDHPAVASTCSVAGHAAYTTCNDCGAVVSGSNADLPLDPTNHGETTNHPAVASTCSVAGHAAYTTCNDCGAVVSGSDTPLALDDTKHGETEIRDKADADCTTAGYTGDTYCKDCGNKIATGSDIPALGHTGGTATCVHKAVCTRCQQEYGEVNPSNHGETEIRDKADADCTTAGYTGDTYCKDCGNKIATGSDIPALGHTGGTATCVHKAVCTRCQQEYGEVNPSNHGETEIRDKADADCTTAGYTGDTYCKDCGNKIATGTTIPALGHTLADKYSYDSGAHWKVCTVCQNAIGSESHDFEEKVLEEATTEKEGKKAQVCKVCGYYNEDKVETIPKLIAYEVEQSEGEKEAETAVYDGTNAKAVGFTAKFAKSKLAAVKINGEVVAEENYDVTEVDGETKVVFKDEYLKKLANANYEITLVADDGIATSTITVKNNAAATDTTSSAATDEKTTTGVKSDKTSNDDIFVIIAALMALMGISIFADKLSKKSDR